MIRFENELFNLRVIYYTMDSDNTPKTRREDKKDSRTKRNGKDRLGSGKGTRQREAIVATGAARPKGK